MQRPHTVQEAAKLLSCTPARIYAMIRDGKIKAKRSGGTVEIPPYEWTRLEETASADTREAVGALIRRSRQDLRQAQDLLAGVESRGQGDPALLRAHLELVERVRQYVDNCPSFALKLDPTFKHLSDTIDRCDVGAIRERAGDRHAMLEQLLQTTRHLISRPDLLEERDNDPDIGAVFSCLRELGEL